MVALALPATDATVLGDAIDPALAWLPSAMRTDPARVMLLAIGRQESGFATRQQRDGPAHGLWQFERNGVMAVMFNRRSNDDLYRLCQRLGVAYASTPIYQALLMEDVLAAGLARLTLWSDPQALPVIGDADAAWACYLRTWEPGKPDRGRWTAAYAQAVAAVAAPA